MDRFEDRLGAAIAAAALTKSELADRIGQSPSAVSNWLAGSRMPSEETLDRLAAALQLSATWLRAGGPLPQPVRAHLMRAAAPVVWAPRPVPEDGARTGGNAALFAINPTLEVVLREALQNALDVGLPGGPVTVDVRLFGLTGPARAAFLAALRWEQLHAHVRASVKSARDQQIATALSEGLEIEQATGELLVLTIADYNTQGLTGPETGEGNFPALTRDTLFSNKGGSTTAGGSHGVGSFTAVRASAVNTVLYLSDLSEPQEGQSRGRLLARSELTWHDHPDGPDRRACDGPMWLGLTEGQEPVKASSYWAVEQDPLVDDLRMARGRGGSPGTTLAIVGLRDLGADQRRTPAQMTEVLRQEAARSFFGAIEEGRLSVNVDYLQVHDHGGAPDPLPATGAEVRPEQMAITQPLVEALRRHEQDDVDEQFVDEGDLVRVTVPLTVPARRGQHGEFVHDTTLLARRATLDELDDPAGAEVRDHVALIRGPRMLIQSLDASRSAVGAPAFQAVLLAGEAAGDAVEDTWAESFLRMAEPPAHDDWTLTESVRNLYARGAGRRILDFKAAIKRAVHDIVVTDIDAPTDGPRDLSRRFNLGTHPPPPERAPRLIVDEQSVLPDGAWEIRGTIRVKAARDRALSGVPRLMFAGESGTRAAVRWREINAVSNCHVEDSDGALVIEPGRRSARFHAVTDPASHPVLSSDVAVSVAFNVKEGL